MPSLEWLKGFHAHGYDSGNVESLFPGVRRFLEERKIGGSYRRVVQRAIIPYAKPASRVLELGPGRGSWSRAILNQVPQGELHTVDFNDVTQWINPADYGGRLHCHRFEDNKFHMFSDDYFDFFWSFGVLCHNEIASIKTILSNSRPKMKRGAVAVHQYGDWQKLDAYGWRRGHVPVEFQMKPDSEIWWPRNDRVTMAKIALEAGWEVVNPDLGLLARDSIIVLRNGPAS